MTKTLTEQWREGTLKSGTYYIKVKYGDDLIDTFDYYNDRNNEWSFVRDVREVFDIVPSYDEFLALSYFKTIDEDAIQKLIKENNCELIKKTEQLEKQLAIATKALKDIKEHTKELSLPSYTGMLCHKAIKEMEGVK